jgi:hypothetical protein
MASSQLAKRLPFTAVSANPEALLRKAAVLINQAVGENVPRLKGSLKKQREQTYAGNIGHYSDRGLALGIGFLLHCRGIYSHPAGRRDRAHPGAGHPGTQVVTSFKDA